MIRAANPTCASCASFPTPALEGEGVGTCSLYDQRASFDDPACVLYEQAKDREQRRSLVLQLKEKI